MMTRYTNADVIVVGLIGERGREVNEFVQHTLGAEGMRARDRRRDAGGSSAAHAPARRVARDGDRRVLSRSRPPRAAADGLADALRAGAARDRARDRRAARDEGLSAVRVRAHAAARRARRQRTPSARLDHRRSTPCSPRATIRTTPSSTRRAPSSTDTSCSRASSRSPDSIPPSTSRPPSAAASRRSPKMSHQSIVRRFRQLYATYRRNEDLISVGAYRKGSDPRVDEAIAYWPRIRAFLAQDLHEPVSFAQSVQALRACSASRRRHEERLMKRSERIGALADLEQHESERGARALAEGQRVLREREAVLAELHRYRDEYVGARVACARAASASSRSRTTSASSRRLDEAIAQQSRLVADARSECDARRDAWMAARGRAVSLERRSSAASSRSARGRAARAVAPRRGREPRAEGTGRLKASLARVLLRIQRSEPKAKEPQCHNFQRTSCRRPPPRAAPASGPAQLPGETRGRTRLNVPAVLQRTGRFVRRSRISYASRTGRRDGGDTVSRPRSCRPPAKNCRPRCRPRLRRRWPKPRAALRPSRPRWRVLPAPAVAAPISGQMDPYADGFRRRRKRPGARRRDSSKRAADAASLLGERAGEATEARPRWRPMRRPRRNAASRER